MASNCFHARLSILHHLSSVDWGSLPSCSVLLVDLSYVHYSALQCLIEYLYTVLKTVLSKDFGASDGRTGLFVLS